MDFFLSRLMQRLRPLSLEAAARAVRVIAPEETVNSRPAVSLPDAFDGVIAHIQESDRELDRVRVSGGARTHLPTVEYELEHARLKGSYLKTGRYVRRFETGMPVTVAGEESGRPRYFEKAFFSTQIFSGLYFGHWVRDSLVSEMYAQSQGLPAVALARGLWRHEPDFRQMSGLACDYVVDGAVGKLTLLDDRGLNRHWRDRFSRVRGALREQGGSLEGESAGPLIFLGRGNDAQQRDPVNGEELWTQLSEMGFRTVVPSSLSVREIALALRDARLIVSAEGSHLNHVHYFVPDGIKLVVLQDPRRFLAYHKDLVDYCDGLFGFVVGRPDPDLADRYRIDLGDLKRTIDLMGIHSLAS